jgi:hypothetical protein
MRFKFKQQTEASIVQLPPLDRVVGGEAGKENSEVNSNPRGGNWRPER